MYLAKKETSFTNEIHQFYRFLYDNYRHLLLSSFLLLLVYGGWLLNVDPRIDTEEFINRPYSNYNWLMIGRQGLILTQYIFNLRWFNPYLATSAGFLFLCISGILLGFVVSRAGHIKGSFCCYLSLMIFCCPIMTEQFYFTLQIFEIAWGYVLTVISVALSYYGILSRSTFSKTASIIMMVWFLCTYQSFAIIYIALIIFLYILFYGRWEFEEGRRQTAGKYLSIIGQHITLFGIALITNTIITKIFFYSHSSYLDAQKHWGKEPVFQCIKNIFSILQNELLGKNIYYTAFFGIFLILSTIFAIMNCHKKRAALRQLYITAIFGFQICPFLLHIYLGGEAAVRTELAYPLVLALNIVFCLLCTEKLRHNKLPLIAVYIMCIICVWNQSGTTMRLIYTDNVRAQEDIKLAIELEAAINNVSSFEKPVAFIGGYSSNLNNSCLRTGIIGHSVFNCDPGAEPHYYYSTSRSVGMMNVIGIPAQRASREQVLEARKYALNMPVWPDHNSIKDVGDYVIVKLSDDLWVEELIESNP